MYHYFLTLNFNCGILHDVHKHQCHVSGKKVRVTKPMMRREAVTGAQALQVFEVKNRAVPNTHKEIKTVNIKPVLFNHSCCNNRYGSRCQTKQLRSYYFSLLALKKLPVKLSVT